MKIPNPDVETISETKVNSKHKIDFDDYNIIKIDRPNATQGGVVAILIWTNFKLRRLILSEVEHFKNSEIVNISLNIADNQKLKRQSIAAYADHCEKLSFNQKIDTGMQALPVTWQLFNGHPTNFISATL